MIATQKRRFLVRRYLRTTACSIDEYAHPFEMDGEELSKTLILSGIIDEPFVVPTDQMGEGLREGQTVWLATKLLEKHYKDQSYKNVFSFPFTVEKFVKHQAVIQAEAYFKIVLRLHQLQMGWEIKRLAEQVPASAAHELKWDTLLENFRKSTIPPQAAHQQKVLADPKDLPNTFVVVSGAAKMMSELDQAAARLAKMAGGIPTEDMMDSLTKLMAGGLSLGEAKAIIEHKMSGKAGIPTERIEKKAIHFKEPELRPQRLIELED